MNRSLLRVVATLVCLAAAAPALAQGSATTSLSGTVVDSGGGVIPGANVEVKNAAGVTFTTTTNSSGTFSVPSLDPGTYTVTVRLQGFKQWVGTDVRLSVGSPGSIKAVLEIGGVEQTVEVVATTQLINTQTATIASTLNADQINKMPMATRNAVNAVTFLPGVNTAGTNRDSNFNGLPDSFVAITLDGVNNNENFNKSTEGLFAMVTPRQDAVEAVTVTTATAGADVGGHGAVQVAFVTRSGSNRYTGSGYHYHRNPDLNTNYWFNENAGLPKNDVKLNQFGFRQGGPIVIPKLYDGRGKAFFFFNYEEMRLPNNFTRTRTILTPDAQAGIFRWDVTVNDQRVIRERNLFDLVGPAGHPIALDPIANQILSNIRAASGTTGLVTQNTNPNTMSFQWQSPGYQYEKQPVVRVDYNLSSSHRLSGTYNWQVVSRDPDQLNGGDNRFPGAQNYSHYISYRPLASVTLRSTLTPNIVNEARGGGRWGPGYFGQPHSNGPETFEDQGGFALNLGLSDVGITNWHTQNGPSWRSAWSYEFSNTMNWQKGTHSLSLGGSAYYGNIWLRNQQMVPSVSFGVAQGDPARSLFSSANFPGANNDELADARALFGVLTGRVTSLGGNIVLDENTNNYVYLGQRRQAGRQNEYSLFLQDSWRMTPTLTINAGARWDVQLPFEATNDILSMSTLADACGVSGQNPDGSCRFFDPTATGGKTPTFVQYDKSNPGWNTDWNNVAPNISAAWRPNVQGGWLRPILGDPDQATLRAGFSINYAREGMAVYTGQYGANPGSQVSATRNESNGLLVPPGETWPIFYSRDRLTRLGPPPTSAIPAVTCDASGACSPAYPISLRSGRQDSLNIFHPDIQVAYAKSYTLSFQRSISRDMSVDIRYVGTRGVNQWTEEEYNERNLITNGFRDEFLRAQSNFYANQAAGRGATFAYFGPGSGTSPLPIYLAYFNASRDANNPGAYTGGNWTEDDFYARFARQNPNVSGSASDLDGNAGRRTNAISAGVPANFFVLNPEASGVGVFTSDAYSSYDALQIEVRRRLSRGLQLGGSYQYALEFGSAFLGRLYGRVSNPTANVRHAFKMQWNYSVPVGRGRRFGTDMNSILNAVVGGWEFDGAGRVQARALNFGNVRLVGMTVDELTDMYFFRIGPDPENPGRRLVTMLPDDVILNTRRAFSVLATSPTGYSDLGVPEGRYIAPANSDTCLQFKSGDCAPRTTLVRAPWFTRFDIGLGKRFETNSRVSFELRFDVLNVFDNINFNPTANPGSGATIFQVGSAYQDTSNTFDPGGRLGQIVWRVNW